jgi:hypothetical protein
VPTPGTAEDGQKGGELLCDFVQRQMLKELASTVNGQKQVFFYCL